MTLDGGPSATPRQLHSSLAVGGQQAQDEVDTRTLLLELRRIQDQCDTVLAEMQATRAECSSMHKVVRKLEAEQRSMRETLHLLIDMVSTAQAASEGPADTDDHGDTFSMSSLSSTLPPHGSQAQVTPPSHAAPVIPAQRPSFNRQSKRFYAMTVGRCPGIYTNLCVIFHFCTLSFF